MAASHIPSKWKRTQLPLNCPVTQRLESELSRKLGFSSTVSVSSIWFMSSADVLVTVYGCVVLSEYVGIQFWNMVAKETLQCTFIFTDVDHN